MPKISINKNLKKHVWRYVMNHSEIEACVLNAKSGNSEEMAKLIEQFRPFIFKTAKTYNIKNYDITDLSQIAYIALMNAVKKYKTGSHTFNSYAYNTIKNSFKYVARQNTKFSKDFSLNEQVSPGFFYNGEYIDCIEDMDNFEEAFLKLESKKEVQHHISKLPEDERELINMLFYKNCSLKAYADKSGMGYLQAARKKKRVLGKLGYNLDSRLS
jgi:RNA polymerase sigma factor (sigma-70 family)